ncbi:MAG: MgtC/SapB family protein [Burkholderiales bacterium]|uniref:MgtC/SapB family protein n=1 Tax=Pigmentiphaga humi TaxID=2478468 RepID=UPI0009660982|nr:MgtC/SapB family protein [Pigmentiphaga humi]MBN9477719.1 MgtC/SapB family protein [Burkholderiales bacterium]OJW94127.1 MAG: methyltransferase [Burkholderiales bacterium 67-32]
MNPIDTDSVFQVFLSEFSDLSDAAEAIRAIVRLLVSMVLGGLLGYERELAGKVAGVRTHMLVALGACVFVVVPLQSGMAMTDLSRVLQGLISGIGFLCAGAILKSDNAMNVKGLTTAASIWIAAAIGVTVGMGHAMTAIVATVFTLIVLRLLRGWKH